MVLEARAELVALRDELARIGGDIRTAASAAEDRISQTARIAEATVSTRAQSAASRGDPRPERERQRPLAADRAPGEHPGGRASASTRLLAQLRAADQRLRESDERTQGALGHLRAVPDQAEG